MKITSMKLMLGAFLMTTIGCSSPAMKSKEVSRTPTLPAIPSTSYMSVRNSPALPSPEQCPISDKSWRKEGLTSLTHYANNCVRLGKFQRVEQIGNWIAQKHYLSPWGPYYLSLAAEGFKEYPKALWMIELAINKSPRTAMLYYQKGRIHWLLGEFSKSVSAYDIAIKENPTFVDAHLFLAQLFYRDQNFKLAEQHFLAVMITEPDNAPAVAGLAETKLVTGNVAAAVELYERAVNLSPRTLVYRFKLAALYENAQKDYAQALTAYKRIKTLLVETRLPANEIPVDVNEKILRLESVVNKVDDPSKKVSTSEQKNQKKVRK